MTALKRAAAVCFVFGLASAALFGGAAHADHKPPASRTPLADTGLWEPPVLQPKKSSSHQYVPIPADEGVAAFYGAYDPQSSHEITLFDYIVVGEHDIRFFGFHTDYPIHDYFVQYRVLHQGENYILIKYRKFPSRIFNERYDYTKRVGFGIFVFSGSLFQIRGCRPKGLRLFEPDDYDQTPEEDIADLIESGVDETMRRRFAKGEALCGGGGGFGSYGQKRDY